METSAHTIEALKMRFWKYHGIGNDFIVLDGTDGSLKVDNDLCKDLCDRNYSIGADGVIYIMPGKNGAEVSMRIINSDGSEAEMCGNGIRCLAKHVYDLGIVDRDTFRIDTLAGVLDAKLKIINDKATSVTINMGAPILEGRRIPIDHDGRFIDMPFKVNGVEIRGNAVSMGNPHFITFTELEDDTVRALGPILESDPFFPKKTNVEFCKVADGKVYVKVYERGASWTLACGTGACASVTAAALNGLVPFDAAVEVCLPGGWLKVTVDKDLRYALMEGPAELVFKGSVGSD